jgi:hypothetical protein
MPRFQRMLGKLVGATAAAALALGSSVGVASASAHPSVSLSVATTAPAHSPIRLRWVSANVPVGDQIVVQRATVGQTTWTSVRSLHATAGTTTAPGVSRGRYLLRVAVFDKRGGLIAASKRPVTVYIPKRAPLPAGAATAATASRLQHLLAAAHLLGKLSASPACQSVVVQGADFAAADADVLISLYGQTGCTGPFATAYRIRSGYVIAHAAECDCGTQSAKWLSLASPYGQRSGTTFYFSAGKLTATKPVATYPLTPFVHAWVAYPLALGGPDFLVINANGTATLDTIDSWHLTLSVKATTSVAAVAKVTASNAGAAPVGSTLYLTLGSSQSAPGMNVSSTLGLPYGWCTTGIGVCGSG